MRGRRCCEWGAWSDDGSAEVLVAWVDAIIASTASRHASRKPLDVDAADAELRKIAQGRGDLLAARAGVILAFHNEDARDGRWPRRAPEAALCIAAGADLTQLMEWIVVGQERAERIR
jgi:hypothetical protein